VDFFLLLLLPGAGDELQGIKKGIIEMADAVLINKADGDNRLRAEHARAEQQSALHYLQSATTGWKIEVALCSGLTGQGVPEVWKMIERFYEQFEHSGVIAKRRQQQSLEWLSSLVQDELLRRFYYDPKVKAQLADLQQAILRGEMTAVRAAKELLAGYGGGA
jgi:LAO/AO transport system kinase